MKASKSAATRGAATVDAHCAPASRRGSTSTTATIRCSRGGWACRTRASTARSKATPRFCATRSPPPTPSPRRPPPQPRSRRRRRRPSPTCPICTRSSRCRRTRCATSSSAFIGGRWRARRPWRDEQPRRRPAARSTTRRGSRRSSRSTSTRLSRNAQVDYLFIKNAGERQHRADRLAFSSRIRRARPTTAAFPAPARGRNGLISDLADEMIPYTPEQLIALANREFAWCEEEMKKASRADGLRRRLEEGGREGEGASYVPPGAQPAMICDLLFEAVDYLRAKDLITVPQVASRVAAHVDDVAGAAAVGAVLPRRIADPGVVSDQHDGVRRAAAEHARQQPGVLARHRASTR